MLVWISPCQHRHAGRNIGWGSDKHGQELARYRQTRKKPGGLSWAKPGGLFWSFPRNPRWAYKMGNINTGGSGPPFRVLLYQPTTA
jgi:hypothetical protein